MKQNGVSFGENQGKKAITHTELARFILSLPASVESLSIRYHTYFIGIKQIGNGWSIDYVKKLFNEKNYERSLNKECESALLSLIKKGGLKTLSLIKILFNHDNAENFLINLQPYSINYITAYSENDYHGYSKKQDEWLMLTQQHRSAILNQYTDSPSQNFYEIYHELCDRREEKAEILDHHKFAEHVPTKATGHRLAFGHLRTTEFNTPLHEKNDPYYGKYFHRLKRLMEYNFNQNEEGYVDSTIMYEKHHYTNLSYFKGEETMTLYHTPVSSIPFAMDVCSQLFEKIKKEPEPSSLIDLSLALAWHLSHAMPVERGNASIVEDILSLIERVFNVSLLYDKNRLDIPLDLMALFEPNVDVFCKRIRLILNEPSRTLPFEEIITLKTESLATRICSFFSYS
ncbi:MAG: hypothetical protein HY939_04815 [Gammaproteobacteria bacterium]|nr:hypothetical protein [Gammaproteobacteria bacterium]